MCSNKLPNKVMLTRSLTLLNMFASIFLYILLNPLFCEKLEEADICDDPEVDALSYGNNEGEIYVFNNNSYWTFDIRFSALSDPKKIKHMWTNLLLPIDAADLIRINDTFYMIFIKSEIFWMYKSQYNIENNPQLISSGIIETNINKKVRAIQFSTLQIDTQVKLNCTFCTHDYLIYDCEVNTTVNIWLHSCVEVTEFSDILPEKQCESLTYADSSIIVIADSENYVFTDLNREIALQTFTLKDHLFKCKQEVSTFSVPVVAGCIFLVVGNIVVVLLVYEQKKIRAIKEDSQNSEQSANDSLETASEKEEIKEI